MIAFVIEIIVAIVVLWILWDLFLVICEKIGYPIIGAIAGGIFGFFFSCIRFFAIGSPKFAICILIGAAIGAVFMFLLHHWDYKEPVVKSKIKFGPRTKRKARP